MTETVEQAVHSTELFQASMAALTELRARVSPERVTSDEHGLLMAQAVALRADCTRRRVGAVIVDIHGRVVGTGRNGAPPGRPGCLSAGACPRGRLSYQQVAPGSTYAAEGVGACTANHAETNACLFSDPMARRGGAIFITDAPCDDCSRMLAGSGLHRAVWPERTETGWVVRSILIDEARIGGYLR